VILRDLLREIPESAALAGETPAADTRVTAVAYDSRQVGPGSVFVALRGVKADGASFARDALARGAVAVVAETAAPEGVARPWIQVADARLALAAMAAGLYGHPSRELTLVGITGTNGKTTTSYLLASIFEAAGVRCGRIGTVGYRIGKREIEAARTTPEAPELQHMLREMISEGCGACVMEVSSHALALRRADRLEFAAGIFTNLTRDHLDFHSDMEEYFRAKRRLAELLPDTGLAVTNLDDRRGREFAAAALDLPFGAIENGIRELANVPGRFQVVSNPADDVRVVVDYAHTDDALKNLLETARPLAKGRLITVFGCGGDRDRSKRPLMGAVAARLSDLVILTSDNPRSEDPDQIIEEVKRGIVMPADRIPPNASRAPKSTAHLAISDRQAAIQRAVQDARPGDVVLIAGKGHEKYQVVGDRTLPFDDVEVARTALARRRAGSRVS
jgi:UDP-N-acetylmuramoyl-L-alanyl-D-glutamate--2,6-diaminopimelate ligase